VAKFNQPAGEKLFDKKHKKASGNVKSYEKNFLKKIKLICEYSCYNSKCFNAPLNENDKKSGSKALK